MRGLIELMKTAEDERVRSVCLVAVLDRSGVKPTDYDSAQDPVQPGWDLGRLSAQERPQLREILEKAVGKGKT